MRSVTVKRIGPRNVRAYINGASIAGKWTSKRLAKIHLSRKGYNVS